MSTAKPNAVLSGEIIGIVLRAFLLGIAYYAAARLGLLLAPPNPAISLIWLPTGIATAALLRWGLCYWPSIFVTATILQEFSFDVSWPLAGLMVAGQTLAPVFVAAMLKVTRFHITFDRRRDIAFFCVTLCLGMLVSATGGITCLFYAGKVPWEEVGKEWLNWWLGDCMGVLVAGPLLISISLKSWRDLWARNGEFIFWCLTSAIVMGSIFFLPATPGVGKLPLVFLPLFLIVWAALRFGITGTSLGVLALAAISSAGTACARGPFLQPGIMDGVFLLWAYLGAAIVFSLMITGTEIGRHRAEQQLLKSQGDLEVANRHLLAAIDEANNANKAKSQFLANMSHEIRTPMNGVIGMMELLLKSPLTSDQKQYVEVAQTSGEGLLRIINDILDISRIEAGKLELTAENFDLEKEMDVIVKSLTSKIADKKLSLASHIEPGTPLLLRGDAGRLRQILTNLTENAVKFTSIGSVTIHVRKKNESATRTTLRFEVADTGPGIPSGRLEKLFRPFVQADSSTTRRFGGSGLGLAISKHLVQLMQGRIGVESQEGLGSTFWFVLPFDKQNLGVADLFGGTENGEIIEENPGHSHPGQTILLVEDNFVNQKVAILQLDKLGYAVDIANNGREALDALKKKPYALVIMDCQMPEMDGYETTRAIRAADGRTLNPSIPIIAMTAHAMKEDADKCRAAGMDDYLAKPVRPEELSRLLAHWLP